MPLEVIDLVHLAAVAAAAGATCLWQDGQLSCRLKGCRGRRWAVGKVGVRLVTGCISTCSQGTTATGIATGIATITTAAGTAAAVVGASSKAVRASMIGLHRTGAPIGRRELEGDARRGGRGRRGRRRGGGERGGIGG